MRNFRKRGGNCDHYTLQHKRQKLSQEDMLRRYVSNITARHFKLVRYDAFLTNRKRGALLPKVYEALEMTPTRETSEAWDCGADKIVPGHRPIPVYPEQRLAVFCRRHGGRARHKNAFLQAAPDG